MRQTETVELPSGKVVTIQEMTTKEQSLLTNKKKLRSGVALDELLRNCLDGSDEDIETWLIGDRYYLMIAIRKLTFGDDFEFSVKCPYCDFKSSQSILLSELKTQKPKIDPDGEGETILPQTGKKVKFRLLKGKDERTLMKMGKNDDNFVAGLLRLHTTEVEGESDLMDFFSALNAVDSKHLQEEIEKVDCGVDTLIECECPECQEDYEIDMPMDRSFFSLGTERRKT